MRLRQHRRVPGETITPGRLAFGPTSGSTSGWFGMAFAAILIVVALWNGTSRGEWQVVACACFGAALCWTVMLRPRVVFAPSALVLRNLLSDVTIPYLLLDSVVVRTVTCAFVDGHRYVGLGVGRSRASMTRKPDSGMFSSRASRAGAVTSGPGAAAISNDQLPELVESEAHDRLVRARQDALGVGEQVRRTPAVPEIVAILVTLAGVVVSFVL